MTEYCITCSGTNNNINTKKFLWKEFFEIEGLEKYVFDKFRTTSGCLSSAYIRLSIPSAINVKAISAAILSPHTSISDHK